MNTEPVEAQKLLARGFQGLCARQCGTSKVVINYIMTGKRRANPDIAEKMEDFFFRHGIPLSRWDLIYGFNKVRGGMSLTDYLKNKLKTEKGN